MLQTKYAALITEAQKLGVANLAINETDGVLHIDGEAPNGAAKDSLWALYNQIDPNFLSGDLVLNVNTGAVATGTRLRVSTDSSNLNIRKGPGVDQPIVGKAAHGAEVMLVSQASAEWWLVRTDAGEEGYAYAQYLSPVS